MPKSMIKRLQVGWNVEFCFQINPLTLLWNRFLLEILY
jgi:hypothetical protein